MTNRVIGPGVSLPPAQTLYPSNLQASGVPYTTGNNTVTLAAGNSIQIPAGDWFIDLGKYSILEIQDPEISNPISQAGGVWRPLRTQRGSFTIYSDGVNYRISNLTGCPVTAVVTAGGSGYVQASTTVTAATGISTWKAIVGGRLDRLSVTAAGSGYGMAPQVYIPHPAAGGAPATAVATISGGVVTAITITNAGAGYATAPPIRLLPNQFDPNYASIVNATGESALTGSTQVCAVICTNPGGPLASAPTLAISGVGSSATATAYNLTTISQFSITAQGSGTITGAGMMTFGGVPAAGAFTNPAVENTDFLPRPAQIALTLTGSLATGAQVVDGGMFLGTTSLVTLVNGGVVVNPITAQFTQGSASDTIIIQPL